MPGDSDDKFATFALPDITKVDPTKTTKFSSDKNLRKGRQISRGLNLEGMCKNKRCALFGKMVWTGLGYGTFNMAEQVCKAKCPQCQKPTKGDKRIGIFKSKLTGRGMKAIRKNVSIDQVHTDDQDEESTKNGDGDENEEVQIQLPKIVCDVKQGCLVMDGVNGPFVQWRYMTLKIEEVSFE